MSDIIFKQANACADIEEAFAVRRAVFIEEQNIPAGEEYDGLDRGCLHFIARDSNKVIGTARVRFIPPDIVKIERMAVLKDFRRQKVGTGILRFVEEEIKRRGFTTVVLHAQMVAVPFYKSCGFHPDGGIFYEAGIEHIKMWKSFQSLT